MGDGNRTLLEDDRLVAVKEDAVFYVPADGAGEHDFFDIATLLDQIIDRVSVMNADDVLLDNGAIVEHLSNVVGSSADQFDSPLKSLVVGLGANEGGKKRMVDVNQILRAPGCDEFVRKHLHVAGKHDKIAFVFANQRQLFLLDLVFIILCDRQGEVRDVIEVSDALVIGMVRDDQRDFARQFATLMAIEKVLQAMVVSRDKNSDAGTIGGMRETPVHVEFAGNRGKARTEL